MVYRSMGTRIPWRRIVRLVALVPFVAGGAASLPTHAASRLYPYGTQNGLSRPASNLTYHGGPVMVGTVKVYAIFWEPTGSYVSPSYNSLILRYLQDVGGSPLYHDLTQYGDRHGQSPVTSVLGGSWLDTRSYPGQELAQRDIQHEVTLAMKTNGWTPSLQTMFAVFSAKGERMCSNVYGCTFTSLCAFHYFFGHNTIYAAVPYAGTDLSSCGVPKSPNHDVDADSGINLMSHEQFEATTDPRYNAWFGSSNYYDEIGDKCVWQFGPPDKHGGDVIWNGDPYEVQFEWDNASSSCVLQGP